MATFGKALANGFALSALMGRRDVLELGGLSHSRERVWLLSTTHGAETHAMAAAVATIHEYRTSPVIETLYARGDQLRAGFEEQSRRLGIDQHVKVMGRSCCLQYATLDEKRQPSQGFRALFMQELIRGGVLAPSFVVSMSHTENDIDFTVDAVAKALEVYRKALDQGFSRYLVGRPLKPVYRRYN
jgi:glutamate-1-semialdehyde 2,1-aminomutase